MRDSSRLRLGEMRAVFRLLHEVREVASASPDPLAWQQHMLMGLNHMTGARHSVAHRWSNFTPQGQVRFLQVVDAGWADRGALVAWAQRMSAGDCREDPILNHLTNVPRPLFVRARREFLTDGEWFGSRLVNDLNQICHIADVLAVMRRHTSDSGEVSGMALYRLERERPFSLRQRSIVRFFNQELHAIEQRWPQRGYEHFSGLTPRQAQVLHRLLDGDSLKEIARKLGLSRHTINDHVKALHHHFAVSTRGELLAKVHGLNGLSHAPTPPPFPTPPA